MKQIARRVIAAGMALTLLTAPVVSAHPGHVHEDEPTSDTTRTKSTTTTAPDEERVNAFRQQIDERLKNIREERMGVADDLKAQARERLDNAKKQMCEKHESRINKIMSNMSARRQAAFDRITQVSDAVQTYYANHELTISDYDTLVAIVAAAKSAAEAGIVEQRSAPKLDCTGTGPKADMEDFRSKRENSIEAMKEYRTAVKALVHAVREASEGEKS